MRATISDRCRLRVVIGENQDAKSALARGQEPGPDSNEIALEFDLFRLFEQMRDEEKLKLAEALTWGVVLEQAIARLTGESESWSGDDENLSAGVMRKIHQRAVGSLRDFWEVERKLHDFARDLEHSETLYWKLWHDKSPAPLTHPDGSPVSTVADVFQYVLRRSEYDVAKPGLGRHESSPQFNGSDRFEAFKDKVFDLLTRASSADQPADGDSGAPLAGIDERKVSMHASILIVLGWLRGLDPTAPGNAGLTRCIAELEKYESTATASA